MKEHPIIFSGEMVRAILAGKKTQTRRVMKPQPIIEPDSRMHWKGVGWTTHHERLTKSHMLSRCPYGVPGERLWVRETWKPGAWNDDGQTAIDYKASPELTHTPWIYLPGDGFAAYHKKITDEVLSTGLQSDDDGYFHWEPGKSPLKWRPSIFMPRWASRIVLEITSVRVERVQEISEQDAMAEGVYSWMLQNPTRKIYKPEYHMLWDKINAKRGFGWDVNPWVWVIEFKRVEAQKGKQ